MLEHDTKSRKYKGKERYVLLYILKRTSWKNPHNPIQQKKWEKYSKHK